MLKNLNKKSNFLKAQTIIKDNNEIHEYLPVEGLPSFISSALKLSYGEESVPLKENRIASIQAISGTGAVRLGLEFCKKFLDKSKYFNQKNKGKYNIVYFYGYES